MGAPGRQINTMGERVFADTNLFLRYLTNDIPEQAEAFEKTLRDAAAGRLTLVVSPLVCAEIVWTLESYYRLPKDDIQQKLLAMLNTPGLEIPGGEIVLQAIIWYGDKNVDFIDAYHAAWVASQDISQIYTFDRKHFTRSSGITVKIPGE